MASFNDVTAGSSADSSCVQQIIDALKGSAGKGVPISITAVSDAANWALDVQNDETVNSRAFRASRANGTVLIQADVNGVQVSATGGAPATVVTINDAQTLSNKTISSTSGAGNSFVFPAVRVRNSVAFSISTAAAIQAVTFDTEEFKTDGGMHSTTSNPTRLVPTIAGKYDIGANVAFPSGGNGTNRSLFLRVTGGNIVGFAQSLSSLAVALNVNAVYSLSTSDYVEACIQTDSTVSLNLSSATAATSYTQSAWMTFRSA